MVQNSTQSHSHWQQIVNRSIEPMKQFVDTVKQMGSGWMEYRAEYLIVPFAR